MNRPYFRDNLKWLSDRNEFPDESVDLVYLDPPFTESRYGGSWVSAYCLMIFTSPLVMLPLALISLRKFALVTGCSACALHRFASPLVTVPLPFTSPMRTPIVPETQPVLFCESTTLATVTVRYCWFFTPVRFTV